MEAGKSKRPVFKRPETQERQWCKFQSTFKSEGKSRLMSQLKDRQKKNEFFLTQVLSRPSVDWMNLTQIWSAVCFTQSTDSKVNLIQKHLHPETPRIMFNQVSGPRGTVNLTNKINHHNLPPEKTKQNKTSLPWPPHPLQLLFHFTLFHSEISQKTFAYLPCFPTLKPVHSAGQWNAKLSLNALTLPNLSPHKLSPSDIFTCFLPPILEFNTCGGCSICSMNEWINTESTWRYSRIY